jgi:RimJ/RimL family protein N-acetyltransferase
VQKSKIGPHRQYVELIIEGAKAGSFEPNVLEESMRDYLNKDIESIIVHGRRTDENLEAYALIFQDKEKFVGFVIISDMPPQLPGLELYGYYLIRSYRGLGHGK